MPFGGALIYVPSDWVEIADLKIDDLMSVYVSMGLTPPATPGTVAPPTGPSVPA